MPSAPSASAASRDLRDRPGSAGSRRTLPALRLLFTIAIVLAATAGISLYFLTEATDRAFAWTIASPLTAAFLGALYLGDIPLLLAVRREGVWAYARAAAWGVLVFTGISLVATLLHLDKFHLFQGPATARLAAWFWMAVYVSLPLLSAWLIRRQGRLPGTDPAVASPLPGWRRGLLGALAAAALVLGLGLLILPGQTPWPWVLTPLTSRAISARVLAFAAVAFLGARSGDARAEAAGQGSLALRGALALVAVWRYGQELDGGGLGRPLFIALCALAVVLGAAGYLQAGRDKGHRA